MKKSRKHRKTIGARAIRNRARKKSGTGRVNPSLYKPCPMCAKLERALHDAIKLIEHQESTIEGLKNMGNTVNRERSAPESMKTEKLQENAAQRRS